MCFKMGFKYRQCGGQPDMQTKPVAEFGRYECIGTTSPRLQPRSEDSWKQRVSRPE